MNYTEKYHLPQWEKTDRVLMEDFNQMCADMEAGLNANAQAAANALSAANSKPTSAAVSQAQNTADSALAKANAAQATADAAYCPSYKPYAIGSYTGDSSTADRTISVGLHPRFVVILGEQLGETRYYGFGAEGITRNPVKLVSGGFILVGSYANTSLVNHIGTKYTYIAFS